MSQDNWKEKDRNKRDNEAGKLEKKRGETRMHKDIKKKKGQNKK